MSILNARQEYPSKHVAKIVETVIKCRTNDCVLETQHKRQTGFTAGSSLMKSALPIEESYRVTERQQCKPAPGISRCESGI
jgi:hypothetical protein